MAYRLAEMSGLHKYLAKSLNPRSSAHLELYQSRVRIFHVLDDITKIYVEGHLGQRNLTDITNSLEPLDEYSDMRERHLFHTQDVGSIVTMNRIECMQVSQCTRLAQSTVADMAWNVCPPRDIPINPEHHLSRVTNFCA